MTMKNQTVFMCLFLVALACRAYGSDTPPKFDEVYQAISANLPGVTPEDLNRAAVQGLLAQLAPKVQLESATASAQSAVSNFAPLAQTRVFGQSIAYFRIASVNTKLADAFRDAYRTITATNSGKIKGIVLDLRFADGTDYQSAAKTADCFMNSDQPLIDWRQGSARSTKKADAILIPVAILINSQTAGAAEALAAALREAGAGLILGSTTSGQASVFKEIPLSNGDKLRVAVAGVVVGDGKALTNGVAPDIAIDTSLQDEKAYLQDPYRDLHPSQLAQPATGASASIARRPRFNEAELVREHKAGEDSEDDVIDASPVLAEPGPPVVADPTLARALDLLKSLAVVEPSRPG
jgi:hypothetical protein